MEVKGRIFQVLEPVTGESAKGPWKKQDFVIETMDQYPKKVCFTVWNDKVQVSSFTPNSVINVFFNAESREYKGRWFTDLGAWKVEIGSAEAAGEDMPPPPVEVEQSKEDGLPF
jgi:hypothetical protein